MKTFPEGGYWKGKNYLFDRRFAQRPEAKSEAALAADVESYCCVCRAPCDDYRGNFHCTGWLQPSSSWCNSPVLVCRACARARPAAERLRCPLCEAGYYTPYDKPDLHALRDEWRRHGGAAGAD